MPGAEQLILLSNDDGISAPGLEALERSVQGLGRVVTVAPIREQSASSRRITIRRPLRYEPRGDSRYAVSGTPADCVMLAVVHLLETRPSLVIAGINNGPNMGENVYYSGTVAAAAEGAKFGIPSIAVSVNQRVGVDFGPSARIAASIASRVLDRGLAPGIVLNVNVPQGDPAGTRWTRQSEKISQNVVFERKDPHGRKYFWIHEHVPVETAQDGTDYAAVHRGLVSVTPLHFDHTAHHQLEHLGREFADFKPGL